MSKEEHITYMRWFIEWVVPVLIISFTYFILHNRLASTGEVEAASSPRTQYRLVVHALFWGSKCELQSIQE